jgi:hypothetical protein
MGMPGASPVAWPGGPTAADIMEGLIADIMERRRGMGAVAIEH